MTYGLAQCGHWTPFGHLSSRTTEKHFSSSRRRIRFNTASIFLKALQLPETRYEPTAKDFRTWGGTLLAAEYLAENGTEDSERRAKKVLVDCVKVVAEDLGNTPAVTRSSYICPVIFDRYLEGKVLDDYEPRTVRQEAELEGLTRSEAALKRMLESEQALRTRRQR